MPLETKTVLITVKTYPNPSRKYGETVCCAGIDTENACWIRLYPIPYRDLDRSSKFRKYNIIRVRCKKANDDLRVESYKVDADSIEIVDHLDTGNKRDWAARKKLVMPTLTPSFCQILEDASAKKSLGMFKPSDIAFTYKKAPPADEDKRRSCYAQLSFLDAKKEAVEKIPYDFYYHFKCSGSTDCPGHKLLITDWELGQAYRDWRLRYSKGEELFSKIREKWLDNMCSKRKDTHFFVGNMKRFRKQFMVLGVFYPPKPESTLFTH